MSEMSEAVVDAVARDEVLNIVADYVTLVDRVEALPSLTASREDGWRGIVNQALGILNDSSKPTPDRVRDAKAALANLPPQIQEGSDNAD